MRKHKLLVIGCNGFIGSNSVLLLSKDFDIIGCDLPKTSIHDHRYYSVNFETPNFEQIFKQHNDIFGCIYAAGSGHVGKSWQDPIYDFTANVTHIASVLAAIKKYTPNCKFIHLSSAAVYGNPDSLPIKETQVIRPISPYGFHKRCAEELCLEYSNLFDLKTCSVRIFSAIGAGLRKQFFWDLYQKVIKNNSIDLFGTGHETRDFVDIQDIVQCFAILLQKSNLKGECINIGNGEEVSIKTAAAMYLKLLKLDKDITFNNNSLPGYPEKWKADISLINSYGYKRSVSFEESLKRQIEWIKKESTL